MRTSRSVDLAVVVVVVLAVMFLRVDAPALHVFGVLQARAFPGRHHAVGLGPVFLRLQTLLPAFEARCFARRERARLDTLLDALFLVDLALVDPGRRVRLREGAKR